jgi:hypothetical protein
MLCLAFVIKLPIGVNLKKQSQGKGAFRLPGIRGVSIHIVVVKKTFRYSNVFFYNHLYRPPVFRNLILKSGIKGIHTLCGIHCRSQRRVSRRWDWFSGSDPPRKR